MVKSYTTISLSIIKIIFLNIITKVKTSVNFFMVPEYVRQCFCDSRLGSTCDPVNDYYLNCVNYTGSFYVWDSTYGGQVTYSMSGAVSIKDPIYLFTTEPQFYAGVPCSCP